MKFKNLVFPILLSTPLYGFEINTHQAITRCALGTACLRIEAQQGAQNLNYFALTMKLNNIDYEGQLFEKYEPKTYFEYAITGEGLGGRSEDHLGKSIGFTKGQTYLKNIEGENSNLLVDVEGKPTSLIDYSKNSYISLIEAGSILEDAVYHKMLLLGIKIYPEGEQRNIPLPSGSRTI